MVSPSIIRSTRANVAAGVDSCTVVGVGELEEVKRPGFFFDRNI
jgi:hypothetical protein